MKRPSVGALVWEHPRADCNLKGAIAMFVAILTIFLGALGAVAGVQELVVQGVFNNQKIPLTGARSVRFQVGCLLSPESHCFGSHLVPSL
jgi:hypothetical protein